MNYLKGRMHQKKIKTPALLEKGLNASFFKHELMDEWRQNFQGLNISDTTGILFMEQLMMF